MKPARPSVLISLLFSSALSSNALHGQPPSGAAAPAFEVASIKTNKSRETFKSIQVPPGGRFTATSLTLRELIGAAYDVPPPLQKARISGGPAWMDAERFDIVAKAQGDPTLSQRLGMLRTLLGDRFKLVAKSETRDQPVYALVLARSDRRLGPQLRKVPDVDCAALRAARRGVPPPIPPGPPVAVPCLIRADPSGVILAGATTMTELISVAFPRIIQDRVVVDRTGLVGSYAVNLEWAPEQRPFAAAADLPGLPVPPPPSGAGVSIFTALQEQLGLRLESTRAPVQVLVIDRAERPTED
jgi:uncharacterized protein (TIGR03435 family)